MRFNEKNTMLSPDPAGNAGLGIRLLGKYGLSSLTATGVDFMAFHAALTTFLLSAVQATILGRCAGAAVSFWMQRRWVFQAVRATQWPVLAVKYISGVFLGMGLNVGGVWLLHDAIGWAAWPARIAAATTGWFLIYLFNRRVVFQPANNQQPFNYRS